MVIDLWNARSIKAGSCLEVGQARKRLQSDPRSLTL